MNLKKNLIVGILLFILLLILKFSILNKPFFWDGMLWIKSAEWMLNNNFNPILPQPLSFGGIDTGHPPLVLLTIALSFFIFGKSLITAHLVILIFAFLTLFFTYLLASHLYNEKVGIIASILLLFSSLFFAQSGTINLDTPLAAFTVMTIYFVIRNNTFGYLLSGILLVLTKDPGVLTIVAILFYIILKNYRTLSKKELISKCFLYSTPIFFYIIWVIFHKFSQPFIGAIAGSPEYWRPITPIIFFRFLTKLKFFFLENLQWVISLIILISLSNPKKIITSLKLKNLVIPLVLGLFSFFIITFGVQFLSSRADVLSSFFSNNPNAFRISERSLEQVFLSLHPFRYILALFVFIIALTYNKMSLRVFKNKELTPYLLTLFFYLLLFSWTFNLPRYFVPIYPLFFIIAAYSLTKLFKGKSIYLIVFAILILFMSGWTSDNGEIRGGILEKNLNYIDAVDTHKSAIAFIEENFPDARILTSLFMSEELRYPIFGYVKTPINPIEVPYYDSNNDYKTDFTLKNGAWYYYSCYLRDKCDIRDFIPLREGNIQGYDDRYKSSLSTLDFDIFYYSPQSQLGNEQTIVEDFNLTLVKRFERNGKYAEIYATEEFISNNKSLFFSL
tara:strand:- start:2908 stop:4758 length:1851 start_codon:yes stop_codon:yes gene_type:complete